MEVNDPSYFGTITFAEPETTELFPSSRAGQSVTVTRQQGEWRPPERLAEFFPDDFAIPIDCYTSADGLRRIVPRCSFEELTELGAISGLAVIHGIRGFDAHVDHSYRAMHLIHQYVRGRVYRSDGEVRSARATGRRASRGYRGMKEHFIRNFHHVEDLSVSLLGRCDERCDVLPDDVGLDSRENGKRWSLTELTEAGRQAAREAGHDNPTRKQVIAHGLFEAAKKRPLDVSEEQVSALVCTSLFDIGSLQTDPEKAFELAPSEEILDIVMERFLAAVHPHLDDAGERFEEWLFGSSNSLVKQISQQKSQPGGRLDRKEVRQALLHLGWRAYDYIAECFQALMRTIMNSMPVPLNEEERRMFALMHERQACYGNLPLALLLERTHFLELPVLTIWEEPSNCNHVRVLYKMLAYYGDMVRKRREADRRSKQRCQGGSRAFTEANGAVEQLVDRAGDPRLPQDFSDTRDAAAGRYAGTTEFIENRHGAGPSQNRPFHLVGERIRERRSIECNGGCEVWDYSLEYQSEQSVTIDIRCECGDFAKKIEIPRHEFDTLAREALQ